MPCNPVRAVQIRDVLDQPPAPRDERQRPHPPQRDPPLPDRRQARGREQREHLGQAPRPAAAWMGSREARSRVADQVTITARARWARLLAAWAATTIWAMVAYLGYVAVLYGVTAHQASWGGPLLWPADRESGRRSQPLASPSGPSCPAASPRRGRNADVTDSRLPPAPKLRARLPGPSGLRCLYPPMITFTRKISVCWVLPGFRPMIVEGTSSMCRAAGGEASFFFCRGPREM